MTYDELSRASQWQSQLLQFSINVKKEVKGNPIWEAHAQIIYDEAMLMLGSLFAEARLIKEGENAVSQG